MRFIVLFSLVSLAFAKTSYDGYQVWRVDVENKERNDLLTSIAEDFALSTLSRGQKYADILISPQHAFAVNQKLRRRGLKYFVKTSNVQSHIDEERGGMVEPRVFAVDKYNTFDEIEQYLSEVAAANDMATLSSIGQSYEGREMWQLQLSVGDGKQILWVDCGTHAREWISPAVCLYGIDLLTNGYGVDAQVTELLDTFDVYIFPVMNPDGYVYTWTDDRLWRKNRRPIDGTSFFGVDLNRNFDFHWGEAGTSSNAFADTYGGPSAGSEIETQNTQNEMIRLSDRVIALYSAHAYSQLWMYPFGYEESAPVEEPTLNTCANAAVDALTAVYGTRYIVGPIAETIYPASGSSVDYAYSVGITYGFAPELRDTGTYGFELPADQILETGEETWAAFMAGTLCLLQ